MEVNNMKVLAAYDNSSFSDEVPVAEDLSLDSSVQIEYVDGENNSFLSNSYNYGQFSVSKLQLNDTLSIKKFTNENLQNNIGDTSVTRKSNYLYHVLMESGEGELLIRIYDFEQNEENLQNLIDTKKRTYFSLSAVSKLIVFHELKRTNSYEISTERFLVLAKWAHQLFPSYIKESFYAPRTSSTNAHGSLYQSYLLIREKATFIGLINVKANKKRKRSSADQLFSKELEELQASVDFIDNNYIQKWRETASEERKVLYRNNTIQDIFEKLVNLSLPVGYLLIKADFSLFFSKSENIFQENWPKTAKNILSLAKSKRTDNVIKRLLIDNLIDNGDTSVLSLMLLPFLFKKIVKTSAKAGGGKNWYPEKDEVLNSFILHIKSVENFQTDLLEAEKKLKKIHLEHKLILQPYVVINGPTLNNIVAAYVVVGNHRYQVQTAIIAVDLCFQCYKVFDKPFSRISNHLWQFLEKYVYKFAVPDLSKSVCDLINAFTKFDSV